MRTKIVAYWVTTSLVSVAFILGGAIDAARTPDAVAFLAHLGYPAYFGLLIGAWKVLGGIAILVPRYPLLKEWAYAGIAFDLTGAAFSHAASGDPLRDVMVPVVLVVLAAASWRLRPGTRSLDSGATTLQRKTRAAVDERSPHVAHTT